MVQEQEQNHETALATRPEQTLKTVLDIEKIDSTKFNLLVPTTKVTMISPYHRFTAVTVNISANQQDGDVYPQGNGLALTKVGLMKLASAGGIVWNYPDCKRLDNMQDRNYVVFQAVGGIRLPDGTFKAYKASKEIDMEVVEEKIRMQQEEKGAKNSLSLEVVERNIRKELVQFREHKAARCETGAYLRVIRALLYIKSSYTAKELSLPFAVTRIDFSPDYSDPIVQKAMQASIIRDFGGETRDITPDMHQAERQVDEMRAIAAPSFEPETITGEATEITQDGEVESVGDDGPNDW